MKTLFLKLETSDKVGFDDEKEIMKILKKQNFIYRIVKLKPHRCLNSLYTIEEE